MLSVLNLLGVIFESNDGAFLYASFLPWTVVVFFYREFWFAYC